MASKRSVFRSLLIAMLAFGSVVGMVFPIFARVVLASARALSIEFFALCVGAGLLVGAFNYLLFHLVVSRVLARLATAMRHVEAGVAQAEAQGEVCTDQCKVELESADAIGRIASAFNEMVDSIARWMRFELAIRGLLARLSESVELEDTSVSLLREMADVAGASAAVLYTKEERGLRLRAHEGVDAGVELPREIQPGQYGPLEQAIAGDSIRVLSTTAQRLEWMKLSTPLGDFRPV